MKAVVCYGDGVVKYEEIPTPAVTAGAVKVRVMACGICGSDIPRAMARGAHSYPIVLGHEFSGVVTETGAGVSSVQPGDHVVGIPLVPCFSCEACRNGNYSQCKSYSFVGSRQQGAFAEYIVLPERNIFKIADSIPFEQAALFEPSTIALHALFLTDYQPGGYVAILGGGTMGVFALQWANLLGAKKVVVIDRSPEPLQLSARLGAHAVVNTSDADFLEQLSRESDGHGFDYVFEAAGSTATMQYAFRIAAAKARVCFIGTPTAPLTFDVKLWEQMNRKEFQLTGSWMSYSHPFPGKEWRMTDEYFASGQLRFDDAIFHAKYPMSQAQEAFDLYRNRQAVKGRILLYTQPQEPDGRA